MNKLTVAVVFVVLARTAPAQAETVNCTAITTLPYTITTQGVYCLTGHLCHSFGCREMLEQLPRDNKKDVAST
jgi:hypothetical protein